MASLFFYVQVQGLSSVSAADAVAIAIDNEIPWNAYKGNAESSSSSEVFHPPEQSTEKKLIKPLSEYGKAVVKALDKFNVEQGITWDIWHEAVFENDGDNE